VQELEELKVRGSSPPSELRADLTKSPRTEPVDPGDERHADISSSYLERIKAEQLIDQVAD